MESGRCRDKSSSEAQIKRQGMGELVGGGGGKLGQLSIWRIETALQSQRWILDRSVGLDEQEDDLN